MDGQNTMRAAKSVLLENCRIGDTVLVPVKWLWSSELPSNLDVDEYSEDGESLGWLVKGKVVSRNYNFTKKEPFYGLTFGDGLVRQLEGHSFAYQENVPAGDSLTITPEPDVMSVIQAYAKRLNTTPEGVAQKLLEIGLLHTMTTTAVAELIGE